MAGVWRKDPILIFTIAVLLLPQHSWKQLNIGKILFWLMVLDSFCPSREGMHSPSWCFTEAVHITVGKEEEHDRNQGLCHPQRLRLHLVTYCHRLCPPSMRFRSPPKQHHLLGTKHSMPKPAGDCRFCGPRQSLVYTYLWVYFFMFLIQKNISKYHIHPQLLTLGNN